MLESFSWLKSMQIKSLKKLVRQQSTCFQNIFSFKKAPVQPMLPGMGGGAAAAGGMSALASTLGIGALILAGVTLTYQNVNRSLAKTLEENNNEFAASNFFANFFGGDDEGGVMNALKQAFLVGGTGILAVTGAQGIIAAFMGLGAVGGPPGIIAGGLIGLAVAGTIGLISGLVGSDKLEAGFARIGEDFNNTIDSITSFFSNLIKGIKSYIKTGDYSLAFESDIGQLEAKKMTLQEEYNKSYGELQEQLQRQARGKPTIGLGFLKKQTRELAEELKEVDAQIENQPIRAAEAAAGITLETIDDNIDQAQTNIDFITNQKATTSTATPGYKDLMMRFDNDIAAQQAIIDENLAKRSMIMGTSVNIEKSNMMLEKFGRTRTDLQYSPGYIRPEDRAQAVVVSGNSTNSNNTQTSNYSLGGLTVGNSDAETRALVESRF